MAKKPWMQFYVNDFTVDTQGLTAASTGIWIRTLCEMHWKDNSTITRDMESWCRKLACTPAEMTSALKEFRRDDIADIIQNHGKITLVSRRMKKAEIRRENDRLRKAKQNLPLDFQNDSANFPVKASSDSDYDYDFDSFWKEYPRKIGKVRTKELYVDLRTGDVPAAMLLNAAEAYADEKADDEPKFIMHPTTFLGPQRLWEDYAAMKGWDKK